jgi:predicted  nucleic acid-binding Zn-ribbon protein
MAVARQLFQLQEIDLEIESRQRSLAQKQSLIGKNEAVLEAQERLASERKSLEELQQQQRAAEWQIDDLTAKIKAAEDKLYSGRIGNPKELSSLQQDVNMLKESRDQEETRALEIIDRVEDSEGRVKTASDELTRAEADYRGQQERLSEEIAQLEAELSALESQRQEALSPLDAGAISTYERLRKSRGQAVARVEQGICRGCRISLSSSQLQQVRGGNMVHCGSCGRILYLP